MRNHIFSLQNIILGKVPYSETIKSSGSHQIPIIKFISVTFFQEQSLKFDIERQIALFSINFADLDRVEITVWDKGTNNSNTS